MTPVSQFCTLLFSILLCTGLVAQSQTSIDPPIKYWIFLKDKTATAKTPPTVEPGYLHPRAVERRAKRGRPVNPIQDAPLAPAYLAALEAMNITPIIQSRWLNAVSAYLTPAQYRVVSNLPFVRELRPVGRRVVEATPAPSMSAAVPPMMIDYGPSRTQLEVMNAIEPLEAGFNGTGVRIGFLDTTFDFDHPVFAQLVDEGRLIEVVDLTGQTPPQTNTHGHSVASTAVGFFEGQLVGPCYGGEVLAASTEYAPTETNQEEDAFVAGMEYMESMGADVVNVSLGYNIFDAGQRSYTFAEFDGDTAITTRAADWAAQRGIVVVTSAGNEGNGAWQKITSPADADSVITVGSVRADGSKSAFSSFGPTADGRIKPDVSAMGSGVVLARPNAAYGSGNGTSFSSPLTAGVVCQILQANPDLNPIQVRDLLRETASQATAPDTLLGWGIIDAAAAVQSAVVLDQEPTETPEAAGFTLSAPYPNPTARQATIAFTSEHPGVSVQLRVYDVLGRQVAEVFDGRAQTAPQTFPLNMEPYPPGLYLVRLETPGVTLTHKLIRRH